MNMRKILATIAVTAAMALALAGCAGGGATADVDGSAFVGDYTLYEITGSDPSTPEDIELLASMGLECTVTLADSGELTLRLFGDDEVGTWEATAADTATLTIDDAPATAKLDGDVLTLIDLDGDESDGTLVFHRVDALG